VTNASPIIALAKVGQLDLMTNLASEVIVPEAVAAEILAGPADDPARQCLERGWGLRESPLRVPTEILEWGFGPGESAVLALAIERKGAIAVLDDAAARACAKTFGVPLIGCLGIVLRAKNHGLLRSAADTFRKLRESGLYLDDEVIRRVLARVGENWK
jgi:predicted nucleic acid-binding protein